MATRKWKGWVLPLFVLAVAPVARAQNDADVRKELDTLRQQIAEERKAREDDKKASEAKIRALSDALATQAKDSDRAEQLEIAVNRLTDGVTQEGMRFLDRRGNPLSTNLTSLRVYGEARARAEWSTNLFDLNSKQDDEGLTFNGRFNLGFDFSFTRDVSAVFEFQAAGRFNNNTVTNSSLASGSVVAAVVPVQDELDNIHLYQGYLELSNLFGKPKFFIKVGRQELRYGNEMLLGSDDFYAGTVHDAFRVDYGGECFNISAFYAQEAQTDQLDIFGNPLSSHSSQDDDYMVGLYVTVHAWEPYINFDAYFIYFDSRENNVGLSQVPIGQDPTNPFGTGTTDLFLSRSFNRTLLGNFSTPGVRIFGSLFDHQFDYSIEAAYQWGDYSASKDILLANGTTVNFPYDGNVKGIALEGYFAWTFTGCGWKPKIYAGALWTEGPNDDFVVGPGGVPIQNAVGFQPLFISRHQTIYSRYGNADVFPLQGVILAKFGFEITPVPELLLGVTGIYGFFDEGGDFQGIFDVNGYKNDNIGGEADIYAHWYYSPNVTISANVSVFFPDSNLNNPTTGFFFNNDDIAVLAYVQAQVLF